MDLIQVVFHFCLINKSSTYSLFHNLLESMPLPSSSQTQIIDFESLNMDSIKRIFGSRTVLIGLTATVAAARHSTSITSIEAASSILRRSQMPQQRRRIIIIIVSAPMRTMRRISTTRATTTSSSLSCRSYLDWTRLTQTSCN
jgi:hypothetical protein